MITKRQIDVSLIPSANITTTIPDHISSVPFEHQITIGEKLDQLIEISLGNLDTFSKIQPPKPQCVHMWHIKGMHDTRRYHRSNGSVEELPWGAWSPALCEKCGGTKRFSNHGLIGDYVDLYTNELP